MQNKRLAVGCVSGRARGMEVGGAWGVESSANKGEVLELPQNATLRMRIPSVGAWGFRWGAWLKIGCMWGKDGIFSMGKNVTSLLLTTGSCRRDQ